MIELLVNIKVCFITMCVYFIVDMKIVKNAGTLIAESYGVKNFPSFVFYRNGYPALYPGKCFNYL